MNALLMESLTFSFVFYSFNSLGLFLQKVHWLSNVFENNSVCVSNVNMSANVRRSLNVHSYTLNVIGASIYANTSITNVSVQICITLTFVYDFLFAWNAPVMYIIYITIRTCV